ncbi:MAG: DMT family transporter [Nitratireductor sp.]|nr:DMT family transporter [Nitratireductor sp.]
MITFLLATLTMIAFAANSVIGRIAIGPDAGGAALIDPASYSCIRLMAGAAMLALLVGLRRPDDGYGDGHGNGHGRGLSPLKANGNWLSAAALTGYAVFFSFSYVAINAGMGALILFASVQATMIGRALHQGDRPGALEWLGLVTAFGAFAWLVSPGLSAPDPLAALLMAVAGICWGAYTLRGRGVADPLAATAGNFLRSVPMGLVALLPFLAVLDASVPGVLLACLSGAVTSGLGYALWYRVLRAFSATQAAILQLTVPVIAGAGGTLTLGEEWSLRFILASALILGGVAIAILSKARRTG